MLHQSKVRKTALCLIYAIMEQGFDAERFPLEPFWEITLEKEFDHLRTATAKGILHACRAAAEVAGVFLERVDSFLQATSGMLPLLPLREDTERCADRTRALMGALSELRYSLNDKRRDGSLPLQECSSRVLRLAQTVCALAEPLALRLDDEPIMRPTMDALAGGLRRWVRLLSECTPLATPTALADSVEYSGLAHKAALVAELRPAAEKLAMDVMAHRDELENALHRLLRNYVPERLDCVDKSILYLCLYELQVNRLKPSIVISEANNLAHEFSGSKSAPFIHGVLAAAAGEVSDDAS